MCDKTAIKINCTINTTEESNHLTAYMCVIITTRAVKSQCKKLTRLKILTQEKITQTNGDNGAHKHSKIECFLTLSK